MLINYTNQVINRLPVICHFCTLISSVKINLKTGITQMKKLMILIVASLVLFCGEDENGKCKDRGACNNCYKIYDSQGNYINGGTFSENLSPVYWDGKDCNGDSVPCGKYKIEYTINGMHRGNDLIVAGSGAIKKNSRSECDSLKKECTGFFYEEETMFGYNCLCCE